MIAVNTGRERRRQGAKAASGATGIPGAVQAKFEAASGMSFEDVRVHYNSPRPAQLGAYAYTQGSQVHIGPGQEQYLEHELGHVIQQKQGIVKADGYVNGVPVNRDRRLERAADLGAAQPVQGLWKSLGSVVQMAPPGGGEEEEEEEKAETEAEEEERLETEEEPAETEAEEEERLETEEEPAETRPETEEEKSDTKEEEKEEEEEKAETGEEEPESEHEQEETAEKGEEINPHIIRYSQSSVTGSQEIIDSMSERGWAGDPIDIVLMEDGGYTTVDNTRVVAARAAGIPVRAIIHAHDEQLPAGYVDRFTTRDGRPETWGQAVALRIRHQGKRFARENKHGSFDMEKIK